ncbi:MAG: hypothetical protein E4H00_06500 [Myxococcales bacterium]|nr:MAG: hypothetical protein E4H00_06500 [Myxococcales bacterium]
MLLRADYLRCVLALLAFSFIGACASGPGTLDDSDPEALDDALGVGLRDPIDPFPSIPPDPFQPGDERLSVGYFYESGRSTTIKINTVTTDYFIFAIDVNDPVRTRSFAEATSTDRAEGRFSYEVTLNGSPFWAGGIIWFEPIDLSAWTTMFVSFKSSDPSFARFDITLQWGEEEEPNGITLDPTAYGYSNDGEWHFLQIPLQDAIDRGWDPRTTRSPFIFSAAGGDPGDVLLIDNLYFTKD